MRSRGFVTVLWGLFSKLRGPPIGAGRKVSSWAAIVVCVAFVIGSSHEAEAAALTVKLVFENPAWSGSVSYDGSMGQPWAEDPLITIHVITQMEISDGVVVWDETELNDLPPSAVGPGLLEDSSSRFAVFTSATDTDSGAGLGSVVSHPGGLITVSTLEVGGLTVSYVGSIEPTEVPLVPHSGLNLLAALVLWTSIWTLTRRVEHPS